MRYTWLVPALLPLLPMACAEPGGSAGDGSRTQELEQPVPDTALPDTASAARPIGSLAGLPGTVLDHRTWSNQGADHAAYLSLLKDTEQEIGGVFVRLYRWRRDQAEELWAWSDTIHCGEEDVVASYDLDKLVVLRDGREHPALLVLVYTLSCTTDISPQQRYLVVLDEEGREVVRLRGWTRDPGNRWVEGHIPDGYRYDPGRDAYLGVEDGVSPQGRIANHEDLDALPASLRDTLLGLWWQAFRR